MEPTGEHFSPLKTDLLEVEVNLDRYLFAMQYLKDKVVIDLGCGAGLGTFLYSMVAKKVYAVDYDAKTLDFAKQYPYAPGKVEFIHLDMREEGDVARLPEADVCVALEVLEHLDDPTIVLRGLKARQLIFSVPLHSMEVSTWHRFPINNAKDVKNLMAPFYDVGKLEEQGHVKSNGKWVRGEGTRLL